MRVTNVAEPMGRVYSSNAYLIRGDWNALEDVNTLIDVGSIAEMMVWKGTWGGRRMV